MHPVLLEAVRLLRDRSVRLGLALFAAGAFVVLVTLGDPGRFMILESIVLAATFPLWRARPLAAVALGALAIGGAVVRGATAPGDLVDIAPLCAIALPILGGSLSASRVVRSAAACLALVTVFAAALWCASGVGGLPFGRVALLWSSAVVVVGPVVVGLVWRREEMRSRILTAARSHLPGILAARARSSVLIGAAVGAYLVCVAVGVNSGGPLVVLTVLPIAAALLWTSARPEIALALTAVGLLTMGVTVGLQGAISAGDALALVVVAVSLFLISLHADSRYRRRAAGLAAAASLGAALVTGSFGIGLGLLALAVLPIGGAWVWRQSNAAHTLRTRLSEAQRREKRAERDVVLEQERTRLAREVHDVVAHSLAVVLVQADGARYAAEADPATVGPALEAIGDTARNALGQVRTLLHELRSAGPDGPVDFPDPDSMDPARLLDGVRDLGVQVAVTTYGTERDLDGPTRLAVYRVVQEALTNALRHGNTNEPVEVDFDWSDDAVAVVVTNAVPDSYRRAEDGYGHGVAGMRERVALQGGTLSADLGSTGLFRVRAHLPIRAEAEQPAAATTTAVDDFVALLARA